MTYSPSKSEARQSYIAGTLTIGEGKYYWFLHEIFVRATDLVKKLTRNIRNKWQIVSKRSTVTWHTIHGMHEFFIMIFWLVIVLGLYLKYDWNRLGLRRNCVLCLRITKKVCSITWYEPYNFGYTLNSSYTTWWKKWSGLILFIKFVWNSMACVFK